ncbi:MAG: methyltransferase domain-containing protein [Planctomycetota bacterium]
MTGGKHDDAPGVVGVTPEELGPLPDDALSDPAAARHDPGRWFAHPDRPLEIEVGPGKGGYLVEAAARRPEHNFLAIEKAADVYYYAADRVRRRREAGMLANVRMLRADAVDFFCWRLADGCVDVVHLYYSDPWPKRKHHKNRVLGDAFLAECHRVLVPGGELRLATDHPDLWAFYEEQLSRWCAPGGGAAAGGSPPVFERLPLERLPEAPEGGLVGTNFEKKFLERGHAARGAILRKPA